MGEGSAWCRNCGEDGRQQRTEGKQEQEKQVGDRWMHVKEAPGVGVSTEGKRGAGSKRRGGSEVCEVKWGRNHVDVFVWLWMCRVHCSYITHTHPPRQTVTTLPSSNLFLFCCFFFFIQTQGGGEQRNKETGSEREEKRVQTTLNSSICVSLELGAVF